MEDITVVVHGALGKMGQEIIKAVCREPGLKLVGAIDSQTAGSSLAAPKGCEDVPLSNNATYILDTYKPKVVIDFTVANATLPIVHACVKRNVNIVIGTTGLSDNDLSEIKALAKDTDSSVFIAANFAIGAVLMMHFSKIAAKHFEYAEIIEFHHEHKKDAPSGTSIITANAMNNAREKAFTTPFSKGQENRGDRFNDVTIHSVRMPGYVASQEVILGSNGETLHIRHDSINRECFMPGIMLAVKKTLNNKGFLSGLENLLDL